jgi:predicted RNase H-like nuclease (RuvC/YqgF family)
MTHDIRQWLAEIRSLQQKLTAAYQERDEAYAGAANWRKLYETEAQQRRTEANLAHQTIETLQAELQHLREPFQSLENSSTQISKIQQKVGQLSTPEELKQQLMKALMECDRLTQALKAEQADHAQTRKTLTAALGDTMDLLTTERTARNGSTEYINPNSTLATHSKLSRASIQ